MRPIYPGALDMMVLVMDECPGVSYTQAMNWLLGWHFSINLLSPAEWQSKYSNISHSKA